MYDVMPTNAITMHNITIFTVLILNQICIFPFFTQKTRDANNGTLIGQKKERDSFSLVHSASSLITVTKKVLII